MDMDKISFIMKQRFFDVCDALVNKMHDKGTDQETIKFVFNDIVFQVTCKKK